MASHWGFQAVLLAAIMSLILLKSQIKLVFYSTSNHFTWRLSARPPNIVLGSAQVLTYLPWDAPRLREFLTIHPAQYNHRESAAPRRNWRNWTPRCNPPEKTAENDGELNTNGWRLNRLIGALFLSSLPHLVLLLRRTLHVTRPPISKQKMDRVITIRRLLN